MKLIILMLSSLGLYHYTSQKSFFFKKHHSIEHREFHSWSKKNISLYKAIVLGEKSSLSKKDKDIFRQLGVIHILTPSGLHLSSLLFPIRALLAKRKTAQLCFFLSVILSLWGQYHSLRRMSYFYTLSIFTNNVVLRFWLSFLLDLVMGGYEKSPLSFILSLLFWGTIIYSMSKKEMIYSLFFSQMICAFFFQNSMSLLGLIVNPILSTIFSISFPVLFSNFFVWTPFDSLCSMFVSSVYNICSHLSSYSCFTFKVGLSHLFVFLCIQKNVFHHILNRK